jgi:hypothetical protein
MNIFDISIVVTGPASGSHPLISRHEEKKPPAAPTNADGTFLH